MTITVSSIADKLEIGDCVCQRQHSQPQLLGASECEQSLPGAMGIIEILQSRIHDRVQQVQTVAILTSAVWRRMGQNTLRIESLKEFDDGISPYH